MLNESITIVSILGIAEKYCAYQERSTSDVRNKLTKLSATEAQIIFTLNHLKENGFLDDLRFAKLYVSGKSKHNKWGINKIKSGLKLKKISNEIISEALKDIDNEETFKLVVDLAEKKLNKIKDDDFYIKRQKTMAYLSSKGFELDLIYKAMKEIKSEAF